MLKKILIADDEEVIRQAIRISLRNDGYEIYEAADGIEALNLARQVKPDLIILDVMMPGMVGYRVCKELKNDESTKHIYIMFLTARGISEAETAMKRSGGDEFITKPFDPLQIRNKVREILGPSTV